MSGFLGTVTKAPERSRASRASGALSVVVAATTGLLLCACASAPREARPAPAEVSETELAIEVVSRRQVEAEPHDGAELLSLAFRLPDGTRASIEGDVVAFTAFRDGAAIITPDGGLFLVSPDGSRRRLAFDSGVPPVLDEEGALLYVVRRDLSAELHRLTRQGRDTVLAEGLSGVGLLAPRGERIFFVGANTGGVAGLWAVHAGETRCLTNCTLRTGQDWGDAFVPAPGAADAIIVDGDEVRWQDASGNTIALPLAGGTP